MCIAIATLLLLFLTYLYLQKLFCAQTYPGFSEPLTHDPQQVPEPFLEYHPQGKPLDIQEIYFLRIDVSS